MYLPHTNIEIINPGARGEIKHALFDFDGTISTIRQGWQSVMIALMVETLLDTPDHEPAPALRQAVEAYVDTSTGTQTIYQMLWLAEAVAERGGEPLEGLAYKRLYLDRLWEQIKDRVAGVKAGRIPVSELSVPGAIETLAALRERGVTCYLASGTDRVYVADEAAALGVADYFHGGIYGAIDDYENYSKAMVIADILQTDGLHGDELVVFGDGYVEIENAKDVGGIAVGVASDEVHRQGVDQWKRDRLIRAGADIIVPDFREREALLAYLFDGKAA